MGGPTIAQPVFGGGPAGPAGGNSLVNTILSQILGPNYQNLLNGVNNGANGSGGAPASLQDVAALITAQSNASQGYARRNLMENAIMQQGAAQWNAQAGNHLTVANPAGGGLSSPFNPDWVSNQRMQQIYNQSAIQSGQTAAAAASYAPGVQNSVGQQNTGARWNPNTMSGWVSPAQQPFKAGVQSSSPAFSLMSAGI
jgi:hypothetical protein